MAEAVILQRLGFQRGVDGELICANPRTYTCGVNLAVDCVLGLDDPTLSDEDHVVTFHNAHNTGGQCADEIGTATTKKHSNSKYMNGKISTKQTAHKKKRAHKKHRNKKKCEHVNANLDLKDKGCSLCGDGSIDRNKHHLYDDTIENKNIGPLLTCSNCSNINCSACCAEFYNNIPEKVRAQSKWCNQVGQFLKDKVHPNDFICNRCPLNKAAKEAKANEAKLVMAPRRHDGDVVLPGYALITPSVKLGEGSADILGWPDYKGCPILPAVHSVINQQVSIDLENLQIKPNGSNAKVYSLDQFLKVSIPEVILQSKTLRDVSKAKSCNSMFVVFIQTTVLTSCSLLQFKCKVIIAELVDPQAKTKHSHKQVPAEELASYHVLDLKSTRDCDVSIVLLHDPSSHVPGEDSVCHVFMRFHNINCIKHFTQGQQLHDEIKKVVEKKAPHKGHIVTRSSGSNGEPVPSRELVKFMAKPSSVPRRGGGVLWIPDVISHMWRVHWIKCGLKHRAMGQHSCCAPQPGGKIHMPHDLIETHEGESFLQLIAMEAVLTF